MIFITNSFPDSINILNENESPLDSSVDLYSPSEEKTISDRIEPVSILRQRSEDGAREDGKSLLLHKFTVWIQIYKI